MYKLNKFEKTLLQIIQKHIPICSTPFHKILEEIKNILKTENISEQNILSTLNKFYNKGIIRRIGPIFNAKKLGYESALVAMYINEKDNNQLEIATNVINSYVNVTHNYLRKNDSYNLWFTVTAENFDKIKDIVYEIKNKLNVSKFLILPSEKTYKIKAEFNLDENYV